MLKILQHELNELEASNRCKFLVPCEPELSSKTKFKGKSLIDFTDWDVLKINKRPEFKRTIHQEIEASGFGTGASRLSSGTRNSHISCERKIASFLGTQASILFSSKNQAVLSLITALATEKDLVLADEIMQSPVSDAAYLVNASFSTFDGQEPSSLAHELEKQGYARKLIFIESYSAISGKRPPLTEIYELCRRYNSYIFVDKSFSLGIFDHTDRKVSDISLSDCILAKFGSLTYAVPMFGAFISGSNTLVNYIINRSNTFSRESVLSPPIAAGVEKALDLIEFNLVGREKIASLGLKLKKGLGEFGLLKNDNVASPIICIPFSKLGIAKEFYTALLQKGFLLDCFSSGLSRSEASFIRAIVNIEHTEHHINSLLNTCFEVFKRFNSN